MSAPLLVCAPLRCEAAAVRGRLPGQSVRRTGYGHRASERAAAEVGTGAHRAVAVVGLAGGVGDEVAGGDVVVASDVLDDGGTGVPCASAPLLAAHLRRAGFVVHCGPVVTARRLAGQHDRARFAAAGACAVDLESAPLVRAAGDRPLAVVRLVVDTAEHPLVRPGTPARALRALARLRAAAAQLPMWSRAAAARRVLVCGGAAEAARAGADLVLWFAEPATAPSGARCVTRIDDVRLAWLWRARRIAVVPSGAAEAAAQLRALVRALGGLGRVVCASPEDAGSSATFAPPGHNRTIRSAKEVR
ncbi:phosphorylase family protein [Salinifilum ghardaiensis]